MKKIQKLTALLLMLAMCMTTLFGCGSAANEETKGTEESKSTAAEDQTDKIVEETLNEVNSAGGIETVAFIPLLTSTDFHLNLTEAIVNALNEAGYKAEYTSPDADITKQIEIVENYVALGFDCIILFPIDGDALSDAVKRAMDAGVKVVVMVNQTTDYDLALITDQAQMGEMVCSMASDWVDKQFPDAADGTVECAVITYYSDNNTTAYSDALLKIEEYNSKIKVTTVVEEPDEELATGQSIAENLASQYPDIKLFVVCSGTIALGINAYYTSIYAEGTDLSQLAAFSINGNNETYQAIVDSADNQSMYRGIALASPIPTTAATMTSYVNQLNEGTLTDTVQYTKNIKVTEENAGDYLTE